MKIAYICNFSYPFWEGVWNNVYHLAKYMISKGHEVCVFTSNLNPSGNLSSQYDFFEGMHIYRFPVIKKMGSYGLFFNFEKKLIEFNPDIIHAHVYRNPGAHKALIVAKKLKKPCFLTTHAPFDRKRKITARIMVNIYDFLYGKKILNSYSKVIAITKWELPYLFNLGMNENKLAYIPNGVDKDFFINIKRKEKIRKIIYLGRISEVKNLGLLVELARRMPDIQFEIVGPIESDYSLFPKSSNVKIINKKFNQEEEISLLRKANIFVLPSRKEGFSQTLLEAMAAGKLVFSFKNPGSLEIIKDGKNGFLFNNIHDLFRKIKYCEALYFKATYDIKKEAQKTAKNFLWENICERVEKLYKEFIVP